MKNLLFIVLFLFSIQGIAQDSSTKKNEIGINIFSIVDANATSSWLNANGIDFEPNYQFATGITYKHHWGNHSIRAAADYYYEHVYYKELYTVEDSFFKLDTRFGYQKVFGNWKFKPFVAVDAVFGIVRTYQKWMDINPIGQSFGSSESTSISYQLGFAPTVGFQYQFTPFLSATIEASINAGGYLYRDVYGKLEGGGDFYFYHPIRLLSINYHF